MTKLIKALGAALVLFAIGYLSTPAMAQTSIRRYNVHLTSKTTTTVTSTTAYISSIVIDCSVVGTSTSTLLVQNGESTNKVLFGPYDMTSTGTKLNAYFGDLISANNGGMIVATSGIQIVTGGTGTAGTYDVFITYYV